VSYFHSDGAAVVYHTRAAPANAGKAHMEKQEPALALEEDYAVAAVRRHQGESAVHWTCCFSWKRQ